MVGPEGSAILTLLLILFWLGIARMKGPSTVESLGSLRLKRE
jgi:hypothetical protein